MNNALSLFTSATLRLTVWYVSILMAISILFSVIIFAIATAELNSSMTLLQQAIYGVDIGSTPDSYQELRIARINEARSSLIASLVITNFAILVAGGIGSYLLAKRNLRPIEEMHEAQSRFTSDASHELRTPLASMKLELELALRSNSTSKAELREVLESNLEEVNRLTQLSHNLLQLSRLEVGDISKESVNLYDSAIAMLALFEHNERVNITGPQSLHVRANQSNVEELLTILLDNAFKYSPADTPIDLTIIRRRYMAGFKLTSEGEGIDPATLPHIFDRFYRADRARNSHKQKSYGLGLSLAKKIVELHNGELTVSSAKNAPTTFTVLLPYAANKKQLDK